MKIGRSILWLVLIIIVLVIILFLGTQNFSVKASPPFIHHTTAALHFGDTQTTYLPWVTKGEDLRAIPILP